jgi:hypothetical protein
MNEEAGLVWFVYEKGYLNQMAIYMDENQKYSAKREGIVIYNSESRLFVRVGRRVLLLLLLSSCADGADTHHDS